MKVIKLQDLCTIDITDGTHQTPTYSETGFIFLSSKNVASQTIDWDDVKYIPKELHEELHKRVSPQKNDILLAKNGTTGIAAIVEEDRVFDIYVSLALIRPNTKIVFPRYLLYAINNPATKKYFDSHLKGIGVPNLHLTHIKETPIILHELPIQQKIVMILDKVSDLIAKRRAQLDKLDLLVKARFVEMFGDGTYPYQTLISLIAKGAGLSYGIVQPGDDGTGDMGVLRPVDLVDGKISMTSIKYIDRAIGDSFRKTELTGDELLITVRGTTGITALTDERFKNMNVTRGIAVIRYDRKKINPIYLNVYLNTDESQHYIQEHTRGATLQQINLSDLREQEILVPPMEVQVQMAAFAEQTEKSKSAIQQSLDKLETLKKALMQQYFG